MLLGKENDALFKRAIAALAPYREDLLCIGDCASALYRYHPHAGHLPWEYLGTRDIDVAVERSLPVHGKPIGELMREAGFREEYFGSSGKPVVKYVHEEVSPTADLEFLCDLPGSGRESTHTVQPGLEAQSLRYLRVLFNGPWQVDLGRVPDFEGFSGTRVQIPNPAAYVVQKILIRRQRRLPAAMEKDCFYIYEIALLFRNAKDLLRDAYVSLDVPAKWKGDFEADARRLFASPDSDGPVAAFALAQDSSYALSERDLPTAEMIHRAVMNLLAAMNTDPD